MASLVKNVLTLGIFIFAAECRYVFCVDITWTKYDYSGKTNGRCIRNETVFEVEEQDPGTCGQMCHINSVCESVIFNTDTRLCIGCRYKHDDMPAPENEHTRSELSTFSKAGIRESDCLEIKHNRPHAPSGPYLITLWKSKKTLTVYCEMVDGGGGWTVFQNRKMVVSFNRNFSEYENGFGDINGEFWLGLKYIKEIADQSHTNIRLSINKDYFSDGWLFFTDRVEEFRGFGIQGRNYRFTMDTDPLVYSTGSLKGGPHSSGFAASNLTEFSTFDKDNDKISNRNCAEENYGGWWYDDNDCGRVNLNGAYIDDEQADSNVDNSPGFKYFKNFLTASKMMLRRSIKPEK